MKRPSGFDGRPERPEPERSEPARAAQSARSGSETPDAPGAPHAEGSGARDEGSGSEVSSPVAPTVDLSEVRERRAGLLVASRSADPVRAAEKRVREAEKRLKQRERRESRRFSFAGRRRRRIWIVAGSAVLALALFVVVGVFTPVMAVRKIEISGAATVATADVERALARFEGTPLALVDEGQVRAALEPFPLIQRYGVERIPPDTLLVRIVERVPVLSIESGGAFKQYDAAGVLVGSAAEPPAGAPLASGRITDLDSEAFHSAALALRDMPADLRAQVVSVTANGGEDVTLTLANGVEVMWGGSENTARKALVLNSMSASLAAIGTPVSYIDVSSTEAPVFR